MNDAYFDRAQSDYDMMDNDYCPEYDSFGISESNEIKERVADLIDFFYCEDRNLQDVSYHIYELAKLTGVYFDKKLLENFKG